ncbi:MAG: lipoyl(octanoyl) transferase LipB [Thermonemataceae bacterium]
MNKVVHYQHLKNIDYKQGWDYQTQLFERIIDLKIENRKQGTTHPTPNYLLFCQHPHVYTLGKSGTLEHLLLSEEELRKRQIDFYKINRGGDITYHGVGQLVGYPILDLDNFFTDIHRYLRFLEEAVILTLQEYNITAERIEGLTGVWITDNGENPRKICAMGVKTSRWVTMHGFALNVNTNLQYFDYIVPCGIQDKGVTSMAQELGTPVDQAVVERKLLKQIAQLFEMEIEELVAV